MVTKTNLANSIWDSSDSCDSSDSSDISDSSDSIDSSDQQKLTKKTFSHKNFFFYPKDSKFKERNWKCDKTHENKTLKTQKLKMWQNSTTQNVTKFKN